VSATRARQSANLGTSFASGRTTSDYAMPIEASWELDLWGRIRRNVESNEAERAGERRRRRVDAALDPGALAPTTSSSARSTRSGSSSTRPSTPSRARST
jgi:hypothetical protein